MSETSPPRTPPLWNVLKADFHATFNEDVLHYDSFGDQGTVIINKFLMAIVKLSTNSNGNQEWTLFLEAGLRPNEAGCIAAVCQGILPVYFGESFLVKTNGKFVTGEEAFKLLATIADKHAAPLLSEEPASNSTLLN